MSSFFSTEHGKAAAAESDVAERPTAVADRVGDRTDRGEGREEADGGAVHLSVLWSGGACRL